VEKAREKGVVRRGRGVKAERSKGGAVRRWRWEKGERGRGGL